MTDRDLIAKRLAHITTLLHELRTLIQPAEIEYDLKARRFAEHTLQLAIQAALDIASHIASDELLGEPSTNRELFAKIGRAGWLAPEQVLPLQRMAGFRNIVVHGYLSVDPAIVRDVVENHLGDLDRFVEAIRERLDRP